MKKRGISQIDWIFSLVIFLLYLAWFFIYLKPIAQPPDMTETLLFGLEQGFERNATWSVALTPLFVNATVNSREPVIASFPFGWRNFSFRDNRSFALEDGRLFFTPLLDGGMNTYELAHSVQNYAQPQRTEDLVATAATASVNGQQFSAEFDNGIPATASYSGGKRLLSLNFSLNAAPISAQEGNATAKIHSLVAGYTLTMPAFNHSTYVVAGFARFYNYVRLAEDTGAHNLKVSMKLDNYTAYYVTDGDTGSLVYNESGGCTSRTADYADFSNGQNGVSLVFDDNANITHCSDETGLLLSAEMALENETSYRFIFHEGGFNATLRYREDYNARFGLAQNVSGIDMDSVARINQSSYATIKAQWGYPAGRDFSLAFLNSSGSSLYEFGRQPGSTENIFVREKPLYAVDKYGNRVKHTLRVKGW